jgi:hypothetical protein
LLLVLAFALALVTLPRFMGQAQQGGNLELVASNWSGGGGRLTNGNLTIESSIGQHDAGTLSNGSLVLEGGFQHSQLALDVNCDDRVDANDVAFGLQVLVGLEDQGPCSLDADRSGQVTIADFHLIRSRLAALE